MVGDDEDSLDTSELPLPPLPPGITLPPPPPPADLDQMAESVADEVSIEEPISESDDLESEDSPDFQAQWAKRKASDPSIAMGGKDSMYGHIDRIATGDVGTLLDRFSDRFGSELDREIIVLRKQQQQDMRELKPTVELISAPDSDVESEVPDEIQSDDFTEFFNVVNDLLGGMTEDFIERFVKSQAFELFESVGADPSSADEDTRKAFFMMINAELGDLPEDKINEFVESPGFEIFTSMGEKYGG